MTKEEFYRSYLEDPLLIEKNYLKPEEVENLKISDTSENKILEVIKLAIDGNFARESETTTERNIIIKIF